jgi:hypothetical protein
LFKNPVLHPRGKLHQCPKDTVLSSSFARTKKKKKKEEEIYEKN